MIDNFIMFDIKKSKFFVSSSIWLTLIYSHTCILQIKKKQKISYVDDKKKILIFLYKTSLYVINYRTHFLTELPEGWGENKQPVAGDDGVVFYLKYLGSTLVEEIEDDESYGDGISAKAVQRIVAMVS